MSVRVQIFSVAQDSLCVDVISGQMRGQLIGELMDSLERMELVFNLTSDLQCEESDVQAFFDPYKTLGQAVEEAEEAILRREGALLRW